MHLHSFLRRELRADPVLFSVLLPLLLAPLLLVVLLAQLPLLGRKVLRSWTTWLLILASLWLLSACGTAPLQGTTCPPVPAELMRLPTPPVLLGPVSPLPTPGATNKPTPKPAPQTAPGTRA